MITFLDFIKLNRFTENQGHLRRVFTIIRASSAYASQVHVHLTSHHKPKPRYRKSKIFKLPTVSQTTRLELESGKLNVLK